MHIICKSQLKAGEPQRANQSVKFQTLYVVEQTSGKIFLKPRWVDCDLQ